MIDPESVTVPYSMDGHWRDPRPRLEVAGEEIVLADGLASVIDGDSLEDLRSIEVEGTPHNVLAIGGSGLIH